MEWIWWCGGDGAGGGGDACEPRRRNARSTHGGNECTAFGHSTHAREARVERMDDLNYELLNRAVGTAIFLVNQYPKN
ncbi:hypothetical protein BVC80_1313g9 [Macleaya cordata]|uniref:Uncharacterized protein n=1 Tax=Macleaya cordata TaxID=56857 RepID=A0A200QYV2_MACCD|nr:hypothetical protein BVC80_1313g9 [Macleaya cordata]